MPTRADTDIILYTEEMPPYNYLAADGTVVGLSTDKVRQVLNEARVSYAFRLVPWPRAMFAAENEANAFIYTIARTEDREGRFDWLVPLYQPDYFLFARTDERRLVDAAGLRAGKFHTTCVVADVGCELLARIGVPAAQITAMPNQGALDVQMVLARRADLYFSDLAARQAYLAAAGIPARATKPVLQIDFDAGYYLAAGLQVSDDLRERVRQAHTRLVADGRYQMIDMKNAPLN